MFWNRINANELPTTSKPITKPPQTPQSPPSTKFDYDNFFLNFNNRRTTTNPLKIFDDFFRTSTAEPTESPEEKRYREFYATSTTESPEEIAYREFYRTSTTESPEAVAYREFYRTSTTESAEAIAYREFYRTSTTEDPREVARREYLKTSTTESPDVVALREFYRTSTVATSKRPFDRSNVFFRSTTKNPYDFSEYDPNSPHYFRKVIDSNSLGSELRQRSINPGRR